MIICQRKSSKWGELSRANQQQECSSGVVVPRSANLDHAFARLSNVQSHECTIKTKSVCTVHKFEYHSSVSSSNGVFRPRNHLAERDQRPVFKLIEGKICKYRGCSGVQHLTILWAYHFVEPGPPQWNNTAWVHWRRPAVMARCCRDRVAAPLSCQDLETCHRNLAPCPNLMAAWSDMSSSWLFVLVFVTYWNKALQQTKNMLKLRSRRVGEPFIAGFIFFSAM